MFSHLIGNPQAKNYLSSIVDRKMIGNSFLFAGSAGIGKSLFAHAFAKLIICGDDPTGIHKKKIDSQNHPDIHVYRPEGKIGMHSISSMRQFCEEVYLAPYEAKWKVLIVQDADRMLPYSANALLKTFEEPNKNSLIILLSSNPSALLPTILSRCRTIHFHPLKEEEIASFMISHFNKTPEEAFLIAHMAQGSLQKALRFDEENALRKVLLDFLVKSEIVNYKDILRVSAELTETIERKKKEIENAFRKSFSGISNENFSATQKQIIEKEVEGAMTMHTLQESSFLFEIILAWYRDLHLLNLKGDPTYLLHRDYFESSRLKAEKKNLLSIEYVQKAIAETRLSLERSTSLEICLENLFLKLELI